MNRSQLFLLVMSITIAIGCSGDWTPRIAHPKARPDIKTPIVGVAIPCLNGPRPEAQMLTKCLRADWDAWGTYMYVNNEADREHLLGLPNMLTVMRSCCSIRSSLDTRHACIEYVKKRHLEAVIAEGGPPYFIGLREDVIQESFPRMNIYTHDDALCHTAAGEHDPVHADSAIRWLPKPQ